MTNATPTSEIETKAELMRRAGLKREIKHCALGGEPVSTAEIAAAIDADVGLPLLRQCADELAADGVLQRLPQRGRIPRRYRHSNEVAADD